MWLSFLISHLVHAEYDKLRIGPLDVSSFACMDLLDDTDTDKGHIMITKSRFGMRQMSQKLDFGNADYKIANASVLWNTVHPKVQLWQ